MLAGSQLVSQCIYMPCNLSKSNCYGTGYCNNYDSMVSTIFEILHHAFINLNPTMTYNVTVNNVFGIDLLYSIESTPFGVLISEPAGKIDSSCKLTYRYMLLDLRSPGKP